MNSSHFVQCIVIALVVLLVVSCASSYRGGKARPQAGRNTPSAPTVTTGSASALGTTGMTVNGSVHPHGLFTSYYFQYGPTRAYGSRTSEQPLGPRLAAYYHESWDEGLGGWAGGMSGTDLAHHQAAGASGGFVRFSEPSVNDENHEDGIGTLHLAKYAYPGMLTYDTGPSLFFGGGDPDLRDAKVSLYVRGNDWVANGSELLWWTQSQSNIELMDQLGWRRANWAYTGFTLTDFLRSGRWERVEYRLLNDADNWTYAGNNHRGEAWERYDYWPIDESQRHLNCDFFHLLAFVDPRNPPKGSIDFDELELVYRNYSLLLPSNGGRLLSAPPGDDPSTLTDGWRHGPGHAWRSIQDPVAPLEFVYAFQNPVTIEAVQLHQNPDCPAKDVEVLVSVDGKSYSPLLKKELPERWVPNASFAFTLDRGLSAKASFLKVRILSGYQAARWGLGEIEVFGQGATMLPDDDLYYVNRDIGGLRAGVTCHYRLLAVNSAGTTYGQDRTFTLPPDTRPHVVTGGAKRITASSATVEGRLNPMGEPTDFWFEYGPDHDYGNKSPVTYGGLQQTPRTALAELTDLQKATTYHYRLVARNQVGAAWGDDAAIETSP